MKIHGSWRKPGYGSSSAPHEICRGGEPRDPFTAISEIVHDVTEQIWISDTRDLRTSDSSELNASGICLFRCTHNFGVTNDLNSSVTLWNITTTNNIMNFWQPESTRAIVDFMRSAAGSNIYERSLLEMIEQFAGGDDINSYINHNVPNELIGEGFNRILENGRICIDRRKYRI